MILLATTRVLFSTLAAVTIYVSPKGTDGLPGTRDQPVATIAEAQRLARQHRGPDAVRVEIGPGVYPITEPLRFTAADNGRPGSPTHYVAAPGARPVISGGRRLEGWQLRGDGMWETRVPEVAAGMWKFEQLWVNGRRAPRARTPNRFFHYLQNVTEQQASPGEWSLDSKARQVLKVRPEELTSLKGISQAELEELQLLAFHKWDNTRRHVEAIDPEQGMITISGARMKPWNPLAKDSGYVLENYRAALDEPGEWHLAATGVLEYFPMPGEMITEMEAIAPVAKQLLVVDGTPQQPVQHLEFKGLTFAHTHWLTPPVGAGPEQAAASQQAAVELRTARYVKLDDCHVQHTGEFGVWVHELSRDVAVWHCLLEDLGAGGVKIGDQREPQGPDDLTRNVVVDDCIIRSGGRIFPCAVGVWIGHSSDNMISHNDISDLYYTGVSVGWVWGYKPSFAQRNRIVGNRIHHLGWGWLSDMGGVYTLGPSPGTVISDNVIHDITSWGYGGWGLYNDEGSTGVVMERNLVYNTKCAGYHLHYGRNNLLRNNILAFGQEAQLERTRHEEHRGCTLERNIIYFDRGKLLAGNWKTPTFELRNNLYCDPTGRPVDFAGRNFSTWQSQSLDPGSMIADPNFTNPYARDFSLPGNSPAFSIGFVPFDYQSSGVRGGLNDAWRREAIEFQYPEYLPPPSP